jgi:hypothetical protein
MAAGKYGQKCEDNKLRFWISLKTAIKEEGTKAAVAWILHFLGFTDRNELIRYTAAATAM